MSMMVSPYAFGSGASSPTATWNPSDKHADIGLSSGDIVASKTAGNALRSVRATLGRAHTDQGYFEVFIGAASDAAPFRLIGVSTTSLSVDNFVGFDTNGWGYYQDTGEKYTNNVASAYGTSYTVGDQIGVAFKNGKVWFAKNNTWQNGGDPVAGTGEAFSGITGTIYPTVSLYNGTAPPNHTVSGVFHAANLAYTPPSGFSAWDR